MVAAAGNHGNDLERIPLYPAAYHLSTMLTVGAVDRYGSLIDASGYGDLVDLAAPGLSLPAIAPTRGCARSPARARPCRSSRRRSAPVGRNPGASLAQVRRALLRSTRRTDDLRDVVRTGALDIARSRRTLDRMLVAAKRR